MAHSHCFFGSFNMDKHKCYVTFPVKYISALIRKKYSAYLEIVTGSCNFLLGVDTDFSSNPISQEQEHVYFLILTRCFIPHYPHVKSPTNVRSTFISSPLKILSSDMIMRESVAHWPSISLPPIFKHIRHSIPHFEWSHSWDSGKTCILLFYKDIRNPEIKSSKLTSTPSILKK